MTIPIISSTCDRCGYVDPGGYSGGHEYALPNGDGLRIHTRLGWCHDCGKLESVEDLDPQRWLEEIAFVRDRLASIKSERKRFSNRWTYDGKYWSSDLDSLRMELTHEILTEWTSRIDKSLIGFNTLSHRHTPARCLTCGGTRFDLAEYRPDPADPDQSQLIHMGCGGVMIAQWAGDIFVKGTPAVKRYSLAGDFIGWYRDGEPLNAT